MLCTFVLQSPGPGSASAGTGALAVVQLKGDIDWALGALGVAGVTVGRVGVRSWAGVDQVVVARFREDSALLFPHAGPANLRRVLRALADACLTPAAREPDPRAEYPEARDEIEARMLRALAAAESPLAVNLLLAQPERWRRAGVGQAGTEDSGLILAEEESRVLRRLITPPVVAAVGAPNIGKSSLLNALAGRRVSIVADDPGTTRDHVGVSLDLAGLVVRYLDLPGFSGADSDDPIQREAQRLASAAAGAADLVLLCADAGSEFLPGPTGVAALRVGLRADLGLPEEGSEAAVSVKAGEGLAELAWAVREALVPRRLLIDERAWQYWEKGQTERDIPCH